MNATIPNIQGGIGGTIPASDYAQSNAVPIMGANGQLSVGPLASTAHANSGYNKNGYVAITTSITIDNATYSGLFFDCNATSGALAPVPITAVGNAGQLLIFKKTDSSANAVTVTPGGGQTMDGLPTIALRNQNDCVGIYSDGTNYKVAFFLSGAVGQGTSRTLITDPGNAGAISVLQSGYCPIVTAGSETRTLAAPTFIGQEITLYVKTDGGSCVVTVASAVNQTGNNTLTMNDVRDVIILRAIESGASKVWMVVANDGTALSTV